MRKTFHVDDRVLLRGLYKRIVLVLDLAEGVVGVAFLLATKEKTQEFAQTNGFVRGEYTYVSTLELRFGCGYVSVGGGGRPLGSAPESALLGHAPEEVAVRGVAQSGGVRGVGRVPGAEAGVVDRDYDGPVLLRHRGHRVRVVRVRQVLLGVQVGRQHQGLAVRVTAESVATVSHRELVTATAAPARIERRARQTQACLILVQKSLVSWLSKFSRFTRV